LPSPGDEGAISRLDPVPAAVPVHRVVAPANCSNRADRLGELSLDPVDVGPRGAGRRVAAVREGVNPKLPDAAAARQLEESLEMPHVRVDAAVGQQAQEMEGSVAGGRAIDRLDEDRVFEEGTVPEGKVDAEQILRHYPAGSQVQMADLRIAHHPGRKPDRFPGRSEEHTSELQSR